MILLLIITALLALINVLEHARISANSKKVKNALGAYPSKFTSLGSTQVPATQIVTPQNGALTFKIEVQNPNSQYFYTVALDSGDFGSAAPPSLISVGLVLDYMYISLFTVGAGDAPKLLLFDAYDATTITFNIAQGYVSDQPYRLTYSSLYEN